MGPYGRVEMQFYSFLNSALYANGLSLSRPGPLYPGERHPVGLPIWMCHRVPVDTEEEQNIFPLLGIESKFFGCLSLCRVTVKYLIIRD
jgi:hypothetical protein